MDPRAISTSSIIQKFKITFMLSKDYGSFRIAQNITKDKLTQGVFQQFGFLQIYHIFFAQVDLYAIATGNPPRIVMHRRGVHKSYHVLGKGDQPHILPARV